MASQEYFLTCQRCKDKTKVASKKEMMNKPNWRILVDERTQLKFSHFFKNKNGMIEPTPKLFHQMAVNDPQVDTVRMDNSGENTNLAKSAYSAD